jgi:surface antigen
VAAVDRVLTLARAHIGTTEHPPGTNQTLYGAWYGMDGVSWCDIFISWLFGQFPGGLDAIGGKNAYTPSHAEWFRRNGRWGTTPKVGAVVFFDFPDSVDRIQHVGIVEKILGPGRVQTIEGNTSPGDAGSQSNGDGVYRRERPARYIAGYGYPDYALLEEEIVDATQEDRIAKKARDAVMKAFGFDPADPRLRTGWQEDGSFDPSRPLLVTVAKALASDRGGSLHAGAGVDAIAGRLVSLEQGQNTLLEALAAVKAAVDALTPPAPAGG